MAMAELDAKTQATYEELAELELEFEEIDNQIIAKQYVLSQPLYQKRADLIARIPNFWTLALEVSPPEIDNYIQPSDSAIFAACLRDISLERFEVRSETDYEEPRSFDLRFDFAPNDWFEDKTLVKRFWRRRARDGWVGLVSEPVHIHWKKGKDLTGGLLDAALALFEVQKKGVLPHAQEAERKEYKKLHGLVEASTEGALSFFSWFGYRGRWISQEESDEVTRTEKEKRERAKQGEPAVEEMDEQDDENKEIIEEEVDIFPEGETVALALSEDLIPHALKYFTEAQEAEDIFDDDEEDDEDEEEEEAGNDDDEDDVVDIRGIVKGRGGGGPPKKRRKT